MIAIYARQSIERPDSVSIDAQVQQCRQMVQGDIQVYSDAGYSGKNTNRPEFERMMKDIKGGRISAVVSYRLDRISRNIIDFANLLNTFEKYGVKYISATEQFDTSTPMGRAMIYIVMVFAQLERETIATRILDNYRFRSTRGLFMGGNTPFGYDSRRVSMDGKKISMLEPNEHRSVLQMIFDKFTSMESMVSICHDLNRQGITTAKGNLWTNLAIRRVLQNITPCCADELLYDYLTAAGYTISNGREDFDGEHGMCLFFKNKNRNQATEISDQVAVVGLHKPIISSEQFIRVQKILNAKAPAHGKRSERTFLAGLIKCKECGHSFGVKYTARGKREYAYYRCRGRESRGVCGNDIFIPAHEIEDFVVQGCLAHLSGMDLSTEKPKTINSFLPTAEVEQLKTQIQNLIDNIGKGNAVVDSLLTEKITALQRRLDSITSSVREAAPEPEISSESVKWLIGQLGDFSKIDMSHKIDVMRSIIKFITIDRSGHIEITYLF